MQIRMETTLKKWNEKKKTLISRSATLNRCTETSAHESSTSREISVLRSTISRKKKPIGDKEYKEYTNEFSIYLLRKLQRKIVEKEAEEREEQVKRSLVALKMEYQQLLEENIRLYQECKKTQLYGKAIESLDRTLGTGREVLRVLRETNFTRVLKKISEDLENHAHRVTLVDIEKKDIEYAFEKGLLGFGSSVYKLLKEMEKYSKEYGALVPEVVEELKEIENINAENEIMRKKCCELVDEVRSHTLKINYDKYYKMALEACRNVRDATSIPLSEEVSDIQKPEGNDFEPCSSSTPI